MGEESGGTHLTNMEVRERVRFLDLFGTWFLGWCGSEVVIPNLNSRKNDKYMNIAKTIFFLIIGAILLIGFYLGLQWLGLTKSTTPTTVTIPIIKKEIVIQPFCSEKILDENYQIFMRKNGSEGGFSNNFIIERIYNVVLKREKCDITGSGQLVCENHIERETDKSTILSLDVRPSVSLSGNSSNDTIYLSIDDNDNVYTIICVQKTNRLNQFNGKFFDNKNKELGTIKFIAGEYTYEKNKRVNEAEIASTERGVELSGEAEEVENSETQPSKNNIKNKSFSSKNVDEPKIIRYRILIGCLSSGSKEKELIEKYKLRESEPFYKAQTNLKGADCLRYMIGNYSELKDAIDRLYLMRKYEKTCRIAIVTIFKNKDEIEVSNNW